MSRNPFSDGNPFSVVALNSMKHAHNDEGVLEGGKVTPGTGSFEVDIESSEIIIVGDQVSVSAQSVTLDNSGTDDRVDLVTADSSGDATVTTGNEATEVGKPIAPEIPTGSVLLAAVLVRGGSSEILSGDIHDEYRTDMGRPGGVTHVQSTEPDYKEGETWLNPDTGVYYAAYNGDWRPIPPVTVTEEAVTFEENDISVSLDALTIDDGRIRYVDNAEITGTGNGNTSTTSGKAGARVNFKKPDEIESITVDLSSATSGPSSLYLLDSSSNVVQSDTNVSAWPVTMDVSGVDMSIVEGIAVDDDGASWTYEYNTLPIESNTFFETTGRHREGSYSDGDPLAINRIDVEVTPTSGSATISWPHPDDIKSWDLATFQRTEDGETVTVDVKNRPVYSQSFDISSEEGVPQGVTWNNDGTKLYIVGSSSDSVHEYDVSTAFDISTASYSQSLDVSSQEGGPSGLSWNNDGSKLYIIGSNSDSVHEYDVSTTYDVSTASYSQSLDISTEDGLPTGLTWNNDGTKMYVLGRSNDNVYEYDVSTAYDISTASYSQSFDVGSEDGNAHGLTWNGDGSKLYIVGDDNVSVYEYNVSTAYNISTASYTQSFDVSSEDSNPSGITWNDDGTKMYIVGYGGNSVYEYEGNFDTIFSDISQNFDVSTISDLDNVVLKANLSRNDTANNPTLDYAARRFVR